MKLTLIGGLSAFAIIAGVTAVNAQANINPNTYPGNTSERYGQQPWEWHGAPGPKGCCGPCQEEKEGGRAVNRLRGPPIGISFARILRLPSFCEGMRKR